MAPVIKRYFELNDKYLNEYGEKTILFMQVGAFFEMYGLLDKTNKNNYIGTNMMNISLLCDLSISLKSKVSIDIDGEKYKVGMAGFRDYSLTKYLKKIIDKGYTCVVYIQQDEDPSAERVLAGIYSIGTYFNNDENNNDENNLTNHILSLKIEKIGLPNNLSFFDKFKYNSNNKKNNLKNNILIGLSSIDILTGYSNYIEYNKEWIDAPTTFDEVEKYISIYNPNESLILYNSEDFSLVTIKKMVSYMNIQSKVIRYIDLNKEEKYDKNNQLNSELYNIAIYSSKQKNQNEIMKKYFSNYYDFETFIHSHLFTEFENAKHSLCFLLEYLHLHNSNLNKNIQEPELYEEEKNLLLGNHSLQQLNITKDGRMNGHLSSVSTFLNKCSTPMGKRYFNHILMNPITDTTFLSLQYDLVEYIKDNFDFNYLVKDKNIQHEYSFKNIKSLLNNTIDIEKIFRKVSLNKITPYEIYQLYNSLNDNKILIKYLNTDENYKNKFEKINNEIELNDVIKNIQYINKIISNKINIKVIKKKEKEVNNFIHNFFVKNVYEDLDNIERSYIETIDKIVCIQQYISDLIKSIENKPKNTEYCKLQNTDKSGYYIKTTKTRYNKLEKYIQENFKNKHTNIELTYNSSYSKEDKIIQINVLNIQKINKGKDIQIISPEINQLNNEYLKYENEFKELIKEKFGLFIIELMEIYDIMFSIIKTITNVDIYITKAYLAKKYNYCKPEINNEKTNSYIDAKEMRHILIEQLQTDILYVPNDIYLDNDNIQGVLLYGTNAVGKSSLIKSIGINIILAQSGFFVPCTSFKYKPYTQIFTRILGNDNIFKGLSTFAVEMSELRSILKFSNENTLILGDELCSGTEQGSAISIFLSGLKTLYEKNSTFIFATHMHEIADLDYIKEKEKICLKHMSVYYDVEKDQLVYDRKLRDGAGNNNYGLEVCKALQLPNDFLDEALRLRNELFIEERNVSSLKKSKYNSSKKLDICEICNKKPGKEIHHLQYQKYANKDGYIGSFHKNHLANLSSICEECHDKIHRENKQYKKVKTSKGIKLVEKV